MPYLLDTNICIYFANGRHAKVTQRIESIPIDQLNVSVITYGELLYGAAKSDRPGENQVVIEKLMANYLPPRPLPLAAAAEYGQAKAHLRATGQIISDNDLWIAAHALSEGLTLVTNNVREFNRVTGLKIENWAA